MLTTKHMQIIKKNNVSKDAYKTKVRIKDDFKLTTKENKKTIVELSGLKRATFYRVFDTGIASAKVILSMAQTLNVTPYYYIGTEDEKGSFTNEILAQFLQEYGYENIAGEVIKRGKPKRQYNRRQKNDSVSESDFQSYRYSNMIIEVPLDNLNNIESDKATISIRVILDNSQKMKDAIADLDIESAELLLKALFKRVEASKNSEMLCELVKRCLLS